MLKSQFISSYSYATMENKTKCAVLYGAKDLRIVSYIHIILLSQSGWLWLLSTLSVLVSVCMSVKILRRIGLSGLFWVWFKENVIWFHDSNCNCFPENLNGTPRCFLFSIDSGCMAFVMTERLSTDTLHAWSIVTPIIPRT